MAPHDTIEAAGVVLVRPGADGPEVAVVHRPHRADWSLPKGKLEPGERPDVAAVREVLEETGVRCVLGPYLGSRRYEVDGVPKRVRYWRARPLVSRDRAPDAEVDEVRWLRRKDARQTLTYDDDRLLVAEALALPDTSPLVVLRHAEATKRAAWRASGDAEADLDPRRTLNADGLEQAQRLADILDLYAPGDVASSDARRCLDTVAPYAARHAIDVRTVHALSEEGCSQDPDATTLAVAQLVAERRAAVWCTHRPVLPIVLRALGREIRVDHRDDRLDPRLRPGAAIVVHRADDGTVAAIDRWES